MLTILSCWLILGSSIGTPKLSATKMSSREILWIGGTSDSSLDSVLIAKSAWILYGEGRVLSSYFQ